MSWQPGSSHRPPVRPGLPLIPVLIAVLVAACTTGATSAPPSPTGPAPSGTEAEATPIATGSPIRAETPTAGATPSPSPGAITEIPAEPPAATLSAGDGGAIAGELGSYTWGDGGSDAPWIVAPADAAVRAPGPYVVALAPQVAVASWTAAWAPIAAGRPGEVAGFEQGEGTTPSFAGPAGNGPWSLKLDVRFEGGDQATWYWRLRP